jgi:hypothetical protein
MVPIVPTPDTGRAINVAARKFKHAPPHGRKPSIVETPESL